MKKITNDSYILLFLILASIFLYTKASQFPMGAGTFPKFLIISIILLSTIEIAKNFSRSYKLDKPKSSEKIKVNFREKMNPYLTFFLVIILAILIKVIGFFLSTILFIAFYMWYFGIRKIKTYIVSIVVISGFIYLLFVFQLNVPLPKGLLF